MIGSRRRKSRTGSAKRSYRDIVAELAQPHASNILITFDDGNRSDLEIGAPLLKQHGLKAQFFVLTGRMDMAGYLSVDDIHELRDMGFQIGSHGRDHVNWAQQSPDLLEQEVRGSRAALQQAMGAPVTEAAIPFGSYNRAVLSAIRGAGYSAAWTSDGGDTNPTGFLRPRHSVRSDMSLDDVRRMLFGPITAVRRLRRTLAMARKRVL